MNRLQWHFVAALIVGGLAGCGSAPPRQAPATSPAPAPMAQPTAAPSPAGDATPLPAARLQNRSRWQPVAWSELPGFEADTLHEAWSAWIKSCERPAPAWGPLCPQVRLLSLATDADKRAWLREKLQPHRVEPLNTAPGEGLLTAYFEPVLEARRHPSPGFEAPLFRPPLDLAKLQAQGKPWYTRQQIDTLPQARAALRGREIAYLADPVDALVLHIQGSGRLRLTQADGSERMVRVAYAGTNGQPYHSVGRWLIERGEVRDASWPGIKAWIARNPQRVNELLWSNPRMVFFKEEPLSDLDAAFGPRGAQGVPLTPGRSIAVDPHSIPYGTPVWLASPGPQAALHKLVLAQDTGSAIVGAVRADYFVGWGDAAGELAGRFKQPLRLWVLWPK